MKVLHIISNLDRAGAEGNLHRLISELYTQHEFHVISFLDEGFYGQHLKNLGVLIYTLNLPRGIFTVSAFIKLSQIIKKIKPDLVQTWMYHADLIGGLAARLAGCETVVWGIRSSGIMDKETSRKTRALVGISAFMSRIIPLKIISCSQQSIESHKHLGYQVSKFIVIPNGYELSQFCIKNDSGRLIRHEWGLEANQLLIGFVARWTKEKDHLTLLKAIAYLVADYPQLKCALIGANCTIDNNQLTSEISKLSIHGNMILAGIRTDIPNVMNALDLHVLSSIKEGFPNVLAEAMACGTPCVSTDVGDASLIIGETGWVVPKGDAFAMAEAIAKALREISTCGKASRGIICRQRIESNFSIQNMARAYEQIWIDLTQDGQKTVNCKI